jgi:amidophosphoribosyltransferase
MACFDGQYPIELPAGNLIGKHVLEGVGKRATLPVIHHTPEDDDRDTADSLVASPGGADALHRP